MAESPNSSGAAGVTWDLSDLYDGPEDPRIARHQEDALEAARVFEVDYRDRVAGLSSSELYEAVARQEEVLGRSLRPLLYAQLRFAADTADARRGAQLQAAREHHSGVREHLIFFDLEWLALHEHRAAELLAQPALAGYRHHLEAMRLHRPHMLGEPEERVLEVMGNTGREAFVRLFDEVVNDIRCRLPHGDGERDVPLEAALARMHHPRRAERSAAAEAITGALREHARVLGYILNTVVQEHADQDRLRHRPDPMHARNLDNEIPRESVDALLEACEARMGMVPRYYRLKRRLLGLERLYDYDRYAPVSAGAPTVSFPEARALVLEAYRDFSPEMAEVAGEFFRRDWIDAEPRPGKAGGAFCAPTLPEVHPYVLMNFTGTPRDVMTLAHELGHGVHQHLSRPLGLFGFHAPLTTSEAASTFGELLVFRRLMARHEDPRVRLDLLCGKLENSFATIFRQAVMTRYEQRLHHARRRQGELDVAALSRLWLEANRPMFGDALELREDYGIWWSYIPHFVHVPFYVYAYCFGELLVLALFRRYEAEGPAFVPRYLELLRSGNREAPTRLLQALDVDVSDPAFWQEGLSVLEDLVIQAERLAADLGLAAS